MATPIEPAGHLGVRSPEISDARYSIQGERDMEKQNHQNFNSTELSGDATKDTNSEDFQDGIERVRAITAIWTNTTLISMFCLLYLVSLVEYISNAVDYSLSPYIYSTFSTHGLMTVSNVMATALSGCIPLVVAKIVDIWGRVEGFAVMLFIIIVGMIMKAVSQNVQTYVAAHVLYWSGHIGLLYVISVMCADMTSLKNRMIIITINGTPRIASIFAGPAIGELFYEKSNFRWAFGAFAIILVASSLPAIVMMVVMFRKALAAGLQRRKSSGRNILQSIWYHFIQFDGVGIILLMFGFCLFMLPFSLVSYAPNGWKTGYIIAMIVLGILLFPVFFVWEKYFAPVQFMPWEYLKDRTIMGGCLLYGVMFISIFCWNGFYYSYLLVVHRQTITNAGYILNAFSLTSSVFSPLVAYIISATGNFKWTCYSGIPIMVLGTALLIPFRAPSTNPGVLALTQILVGLGSGIFVTCAQLAVMVPVTHQQVASVLAFWGLFGSFGSSIGLSIAGAIWNNVVPNDLLNRLPEESKSMATEIFGSLTVQSSFLDGTPERDAVVGAYAHAQRLLVITGACFIPLCLVTIVMWRNINVKEVEQDKGKQTKGTVF